MREDGWTIVPMVCQLGGCSANPDRFRQLLVEIRLVCGALMHFLVRMVGQTMEALVWVSRRDLQLDKGVERVLEAWRLWKGTVAL